MRHLFLFCLLPLSRASTFLSLSTCSLSCSSISMSSEPPKIKTTALMHNEEYCPVATHNLLTNPMTLRLEELSWTEILGQIRIRYQKEFWDITIKILSQKIRRKLKNLVSTCPTSKQGYTLITIQLKALQTRILKMENYEKNWPHGCMYMSEEKLWFSSKTHSFRETRSKNTLPPETYAVSFCVREV